MKKRGEITIAPGANVWPHERRTAEALALAGYDVEFIRRSEGQRVTSADVVIGGVAWEIKSPESGSIKAVQRNLHKALHQSKNVIVDSCRMKKVPDYVIERELRKYATVFKSLKRLKFVNRHRDVIDIK